MKYKIILWKKKYRAIEGKPCLRTGVIYFESMK